MLPLNRISAHPGRILSREFLEPSGISQAQLARDLGISQNRVNELIRGKRGITAETALLLSAFFRNSAEFWMNLQTAYDLTKARQELRPNQPVRNGRHRGKVSKTA
jgi:addiction module HigA family antidote